MITMEPQQPCKLCGKKPFFYHDGTYTQHESTIVVAEGGWTTVRIGPDKDGRIFIVGVSDGETERYYPKFCPECGRALPGGGENDV